MAKRDSGVTLVAGGAGFIGSHLCEALLQRGERVVCLDNFQTGSPVNLARLAGHPDFEVVEADITLTVDGAGRGKIAEEETAADGIAGRKVGASEGFVDEDDALSVFAVGGGEVAAGDERDVERFEVAGGDVIDGDLRAAFASELAEDHIACDLLVRGGHKEAIGTG